MAMNGRSELEYSRSGVGHLSKSSNVLDPFLCETERRRGVGGRTLTPSVAVFGS